MLPARLYHGSLYHQTELMPGFKRSGKLVQWDGVENNTYLYATTSQEEAINLGFGSALEKTLNSRRYVTFDNTIVVYFSHSLPALEAVKAVEFYVYTLVPKAEHNWVKNNNPFNNIDTEWVTQATVRSIKARHKVDVKRWLANKQLYLTTRAIDTDPRRVVLDINALRKRSTPAH